MTDKAKTAADVADHALTQIDKFSASIASLADKLADVAKQHGPDAWEAAQQVARVDAIDHIAWAVVLLPIALAIFLRFSVPTFQTGRAQNRAWWKSPSASTPDGDGPTIIGLLSGALCLCAVVVAAIQICSVWAWVGIFEPKLWLAAKVLNLG